MSVTAEKVKELRELTGVGMGKCKEALVEALGDMDKAVEILRKAGMASAVKKEGRTANEGLIGSSESNNAVALVEVNAETDFVTQNDKFKQFLKDVAVEIAETKPKSLEAFMQQKAKHDSSITLDEYRALVIQSLGENIQVKRLLVLDKSSDISIGVYSHMGGKIVCAVILSGGSGEEALARDLAMHVAAESPDFLTPAEVPADLREKEADIARSQMQGKPANMVEKIVEGKVKAFCDQVCLICQKYVRDPSVTVAALLEKESKRAGKEIKILAYHRWKVGA